MVIPESEIFSPPYLFKGSRPTITSAPTSVAYGQSFFVQTPDAATISKVTLLRLSSVTHAFNMSQHISTLSFSQTPGGLNVVAPSGATVAPPGRYLLFILNGSGVPVGRKHRPSRQRPRGANVDLPLAEQRCGGRTRPLRSR